MNLYSSIAEKYPGTYSIAYGVVADIATPGERGSYVGILILLYVLLREQSIVLRLTLPLVHVQLRVWVQFLGG